MTEADRSPLQEAQDIVAALRALRHGLVRTGRGGLARSGLTGAQLSVISLLAANDSMTLTELSRALHLSHSTSSGIVDRLQARGIVQRTPSPTDRRYTRLSLTEDARRHAEATSGDSADSLVAALAAASPAERRTISEGLTLLRRCLDSARAEAPAD